jgi:hypothetical protein
MRGTDEKGGDMHCLLSFFLKVYSYSNHIWKKMPLVKLATFFRCEDEEAAQVLA